LQVFGGSRIPKERRVETMKNHETAYELLQLHFRRLWGIRNTTDAVIREYTRNSLRQNIAGQRKLRHAA